MVRLFFLGFLGLVLILGSQDALAQKKTKEKKGRAFKSGTLSGKTPMKGKSPEYKGTDSEREQKITKDKQWQSPGGFSGEQKQADLSLAKDKKKVHRGSRYQGNVNQRETQIRKDYQWQSPGNYQGTINQRNIEPAKGGQTYDGGSKSNAQTPTVPNKKSDKKIARFSGDFKQGAIETDRGADPIRRGGKTYTQEDARQKFAEKNKQGRAYQGNLDQRSIRIKKDYQWQSPGGYQGELKQGAIETDRGADPIRRGGKTYTQEDARQKFAEKNKQGRAYQGNLDQRSIRIKKDYQWQSPGGYQGELKQGAIETDRGADPIRRGGKTYTQEDARQKFAEKNKQGRAYQGNLDQRSIRIKKDYQWQSPGGYQGELKQGAIETDRGADPIRRGGKTYTQEDARQKFAEKNKQGRAYQGNLDQRSIRIKKDYQWQSPGGYQGELKQGAIETDRGADPIRRGGKTYTQEDARQKFAEKNKQGRAYQGNLDQRSIRIKKDYQWQSPGGYQGELKQGAIETDRGADPIRRGGKTYTQEDARQKFAEKNKQGRAYQGNLDQRSIRIKKDYQWQSPGGYQGELKQSQTEPMGSGDPIRRKGKTLSQQDVREKYQGNNLKGRTFQGDLDLRKVQIGKDYQWKSPGEYSGELDRVKKAPQTYKTYSGDIDYLTWKYQKEFEWRSLGGYKGDLSKRKIDKRLILKKLDNNSYSGDIDYRTWKMNKEFEWRSPGEFKGELDQGSVDQRIRLKKRDNFDYSGDIKMSTWKGQKDFGSKSPGRFSGELDYRTWKMNKEFEWRSPGEFKGELNQSFVDQRIRLKKRDNFDYSGDIKMSTWKGQKDFGSRSPSGFRGELDYRTWKMNKEFEWRSPGEYSGELLQKKVDEKTRLKKQDNFRYSGDLSLSNWKEQKDFKSKSLKSYEGNRSYRDWKMTKEHEWKSTLHYSGDIVVKNVKKSGLHPSANYLKERSLDYKSAEKYRKKMIKKGRKGDSEVPDAEKKREKKPKYDSRESEIWY